MTRLPEHVRVEVQRIMDREARRVLDERTTAATVGSETGETEPTEVAAMAVAEGLSTRPVGSVLGRRGRDAP